MPFDVGLFTDLDDTNTIAESRVLARAAAIQPPANLGRFWEDMGVDEDPESNPKFDIFSRSETPRTGTIGAGGWDATATTALPVTSAAGLIKGLVMQIEDEVVVISSVNTSNNTIEVRERGTAGTTGAIHNAAVDYEVIGSAIDDVDLKDVSSVHEITSYYQNYVQTVAEPIDYTRGGQLNPRKGISDSMVALMEEEAMLRVAKNVYASSIKGLKQQKATNKPWMTAGLLQQLSDDTGGRLVLTYDVAGALTEDKLRDALREVFERGTPTDIYCSSANKDTINGFLLSAPSATKLVVNTSLQNTVAGYQVDTYNYEGQILNVKIELGMPNDKIAIVNINKCKKGWKKDDSLLLEEQTTLSSREKRAAYNGSFYVAVKDVGYEHILLTGITPS